MTLTVYFISLLKASRPKGLAIRSVHGNSLTQHSKVSECRASSLWLFQQGIYRKSRRPIHVFHLYLGDESFLKCPCKLFWIGFLCQNSWSHFSKQSAPIFASYNVFFRFQIFQIFFTDWKGLNILIYYCTRVNLVVLSILKMAN